MSASPRTSAEPMAFTASEFLIGAYAAWGWTILGCLAVGLALSPMAVAGGILFTLIALVYAIPVSLAATVLFGPFAYLLGWSLRRVAAFAPHVIAFSVFGLSGGLATMILFGQLLGGTSSLAVTGGLLAYALVPMAAVPIAWYRTARRALRADAEAAPSGADHPPATADDAAAPAGDHRRQSAG